MKNQNKIYRLSLVDNETHNNVKTIRFSKMRFIIAAVTVVVMSVLLIYCLIAFTPLRNTIPGYPDVQVKKVALANAIKIDSLESVITKWNLYAENLSRVLAGEATVNFDSIVRRSALQYLSSKSEEELLRQEIGSTAEWNEAGKQMDELLAEWKTIGYATKKENQKIYERFRAACDTFYARKREYYTAVNDTMNENVSRKISLIEQAEALKDSTDWKKTTDQFISLQKQWKEIGYVPRKKADQLWKRFRAACDAFFENRDENAPKENDIYSNLKAKKRLIDEILAYESVEDEAANADKMRAFAERWNEIGHVPYKEKDNIIEAYRAAMNKKFPLFSKQRQQRQDGGKRSPKDALIARYNALQQDITTYENNIGFFSASKSSAPLIKQMQEKIEQSKRQLKELEEKIRNFEEDEQ